MDDGIITYGGGNKAGSVFYGVDNFAGSTLNELSLCCTPVELLANNGTDDVATTATGFFWRRNDQPYLVTNWHVVSGRNVLTGQLGKDGFIPERIRFYGLSVVTEAGIVNFKRRSWILQWNEEMAEILSKPPTFDGQALDIWGVPIPKGVVLDRDPTRTGFKGAAGATCYLNDHVDRRIVTNVGDDCFILGYPLKNYTGLMLPVWKRGSIASETMLGADGRPIFLVDAATTAGMSGAPIVRKVVRMTADNRDIGALQEFSAFEVVGVYAGHLRSEKLETVNLGYGWYRTMIDPALDHFSCLPHTVAVEQA